ncbi:MAG: ATPase, partial [Caldilinea sp.]
MQAREGAGIDTEFMKDELDLYIRARYPLIWVVTAEEQRALQEIEALAQEQRKRVLLWSVTAGLVNPATPDREDASRRDPLVLLKTILDDKEAGLWVLRDFHPFLKDPVVVRRLREIAFTLGAGAKTVILLSPVLKIPLELEKEVTVVDFDLPTAPQLQEKVDA